MAKTYRVSGRLAVFGMRPGTEFEAELDPDQEARLLARGSLEVVDNPTPTVADEQPPEGDEPESDDWPADDEGADDNNNYEDDTSGGVD